MARGTEEIQIGHGGGGRLSRTLIDEEILARFGDGPLAGLPDGATLELAPGRLVMSTDSFVVQPLEFPGGSIGHLAVHGTVNDVAVAGGRPRYLSLAMILEEGLSFEVLRRVLDDVASAARECGVSVVTGDTKVVRRGQCDGIYLNTSGVGEVVDAFELAPERIRAGDAVLTSGPLGDHGMAVMAAREGIEIENGPESDTGPVHRLVSACEPEGAAMRFFRDPTRGGAAAVLNEIVEEAAVGVELYETAIPASPGARAVSEMLGLDLLHVASEGRVLAICDEASAERVLKSWHALPEGESAARIGTVSSDAGRVILRTSIGGRRLVDVPQGELLPRIC